MTAYSHSQELIFSADSDLSAYRIRYRNIPHVVVLGSRPEASVNEKLAQILKDGVPATLSDEVVNVLVQRRVQARNLGPWVEGHYRPGLGFKE